LRPVLGVLDAEEIEDFLAALRARTEDAYRLDAAGVVFPFRRLFLIARRA
jgi:trans-aconitate 2-methyltransferase